MSFGNVKDQNIPLRLLRNIIVRARVPNGLLFWGPEGVGKRFTALEFAKALNCEKQNGDACDSCLSCRKIAHGNHPDVRFVGPTGRARLIKIDTINFINDMASYRAFEGGWRIFIMHDAERMNLESQNHFLKTLEEPPSNTLFILLTEYPRILLPTIRSRCQQVRFGALRPGTISDWLMREKGVPEDVSVALAALSQGQMSRAQDLVESEKRDVVLQFTQRLDNGEDPMLLSDAFVKHLEAQMAAVAAAAGTASEQEQPDAREISADDRKAAKEEFEALVESLTRREIMEYLRLFQTWYRDVMVYQATRDDAEVLNKDQIDRLGRNAGGDPAMKIRAVDKAWLYIERNLNRDRVLRDLFFALAS